MKKVRIGMVVMASGWSRRFGKNKLLEKLGQKPMLVYLMETLFSLQLSLETAGAMTEQVSYPEKREASFVMGQPLIVTRYPELKALAEEFGFSVLMHDDPEQSDTIRHGLSVPEAADWDGCMFLTSDQPLLSARSVRRLLSAFSEDPFRVYRLSYREDVGNPVIFPRQYFEDLRNLTGDHGGAVLLKNGVIPKENIVRISAENEYELYDIDSEEGKARVLELLHTRNT